MEKKESRALVSLVFIFIVVLLIRLVLALVIPNFTYDSYFHLRQVEEVTATGLPKYEDHLSYGGRRLLFLPFFHYLMAFFHLFLPLELAAKIIPNILIASLTLITYLISKKITQDKTASLFSAFIAGFLPILYSTNDFGPESLFLPLNFLAIYAFFNIKEKKFLHLYVILFLILSFTSPATFLLIIGFAIYLLLSVLERKKIKREEVEVILFSLFFFAWAQFLFFKNLFVEEGISFIWQNVPPQIIKEYLPIVSITGALILVSIIPFLAGIFMVYRSLFQSKNEQSFLLISFAVSTTLLAWFRLIEFRLALAFFSIILAILFAQFYREFKMFMSKTRISNYQGAISLLLLILLSLTMIFPAAKAAFQQETPSDEEVNAFKWIKDNTPENAMILALLEEGHLVTYYSQRKNIMDNKFSRIKNIEERFAEFNTLFITRFQTLAVGLIDKYGIDYIVFTPQAQKKYQRANFKYLSIDCFERLYSDETKIYRITCSLNQIKEKEAR